MKQHSFAQSFIFAAKGVKYSLVSQRNMKIHLLATVIVMGAGIYFSLELWEWCLIVFAIGLVWVAEIFNTALEEMIDLVSPHYNVRAGNAKNLAAGAVLIAAINAFVIGVLVLGPYIINK